MTNICPWYNEERLKISSVVLKSKNAWRFLGFGNYYWKQATLYKINLHALQKVWTFLGIRVWTFSFPRSLIADIFELFPDLIFYQLWQLRHIYNILLFPFFLEFKNNFLRLKKLVLVGGPDDGVITPWQSRYFLSLSMYNRENHV